MSSRIFLGNTLVLTSIVMVVLAITPVPTSANSAPMHNNSLHISTTNDVTGALVTPLITGSWHSGRVRRVTLQGRTDSGTRTKIRAGADVTTFAGKSRHLCIVHKVQIRSYSDDVVGRETFGIRFFGSGHKIYNPAVDEDYTASTLADEQNSGLHYLVTERVTEDVPKHARRYIFKMTGRIAKPTRRFAESFAIRPRRCS